MKKIFLFVAILCVLVASSCSDGYDDTALRKDLSSLEQRVVALEELCRQMNTNLTSLQAIVTAQQQNDYITNVAPIMKDGVTVGYTITFAKLGSITIYNGVDGNTPQIGVVKNSDGNYYWTLNGEYLLDDNGKPIRAEGKDGQNGEDGTDGVNGVDGADGVTPKLKIENGCWYVSYDNGSSWNQVGDSDDVAGENVFEYVDIKEDCVIFTLSDGTYFTLPRFDGNSPVGTAPANNEIWYTTVDGSTVTLGATQGFGANIVSNIMYKNGVGVITFDGEINAIPNNAFFIGDVVSGFVVAISNNLKTITLPNVIKAVGERSFAYCSHLVEFSLPNSVTAIGNEAFRYCDSMESITIPNNVTALGDNIFYGCESLTAFYGKFASNDNKSLVVGGVLKAFAGKGVTEYTIPNEVASIDDGIFKYNEILKKVIISDNVECIKDETFYGCSSLEEVIIGKSVFEIGEYAFLGCYALKKINIPDNVKYIRDLAFQDCKSLEEVTLGKSLLEIGRCAFSMCPIKNIVIPDSVVSIMDEAFYNCDLLEEVAIGASVAEIGHVAFGYCENISTVYCKPVTPPQISDLFGGTRSSGSRFTIYVPTASVAKYKTDENWIRYEYCIDGYDYN